ncbi:hypothetical protein QC762_118300 [Podospora pseudocomata]|uniref:Glycosyltransferase 2-like domain-containing protein n=1 Tax=Podospora pseudocomata TaxID=2093779 RepID=A0ABR0GXH0_9PEZI|nr:hypothetical protein QC762_118300 [Podospora pseudocomata]
MHSPVEDDYRLRQAAKAPLPTSHGRNKSTSSILSTSKASLPLLLDSLGNPITFDNTITDTDCMVVTEIGNDEEYDQIQSNFGPVRRFLTRFVFLTAIIPCILLLWASKIQGEILLALGQDGSLGGVKLYLAWFAFAIEGLWSADAIAASLVKAASLFARYRPRLRLLGDNVPCVDIIIPVCNEKLDIIQDTVRATLNIDYPAHRFRVIVSDDGRNQKLEAWVLQLAADTPNLYYTARVKYGPAGYKAGNLNHAITVSDTLPGGRAELVAGLDADMIPEKRWLRACVAHLIRDPKMGVVCPAQLFYNVPDNDPLNQQSSINWLCMDIIRDHAGLGWNLGSGWVVRREAVDDIGGFPTDCLVEDIYSSMLQMAEGWRSAYLAESLQYGLVPETYAAHVKQFARWYIGGAQMFVNFKGYLSSKLTKQMTLAAKLVGFSSGINVHAKAQLATVFMLLTPFVFLTGTHLMYWRDEAEMKLLLRLYCAIVLTRYLHDCHIGVMAGYRVAVMETGMMRYMSHYYTVAWFKTFFLASKSGTLHAVLLSASGCAISFSTVVPGFN